MAGYDGVDKFERLKKFGQSADEKIFSEILELFKKAIGENITEAFFDLGMLKIFRAHNKANFKKLLQEGVRHLECAANAFQPHVMANFVLGKLYLFGDLGVQQNSEKGKGFLKKAKDLGSEEASKILALLDRADKGDSAAKEGLNAYKFLETREAKSEVVSSSTSSSSSGGGVRGATVSASVAPVVELTTIPRTSVAASSLTTTITTTTITTITTTTTTTTQLRVEFSRVNSCLIEINRFLNDEVGKNKKRGIEVEKYLLALFEQLKRLYFVARDEKFTDLSALSGRNYSCMLITADLTSIPQKINGMSVTAFFKEYQTSIKLKSILQELIDAGEHWSADNRYSLMIGDGFVLKIVPVEKHKISQSVGNMTVSAAAAAAPAFRNT